MEGPQSQAKVAYKLPILPALQRVIDASPCGDMTFLINDFGGPFTDAGFGHKMRPPMALAKPAL